MIETSHMQEWLTTLTPWHWIAWASVLIIFELLLGSSFFLLWLALVALGVAGVLWYMPLGWPMQFFLFALGSVISIFAWYFYLKTHVSHTREGHPLNQRNAQYIGRRVVLTEPLINGHGKVYIDGILWHIEGPSLEKGTTVIVIGTTEMGLKVKAVE